MLTEMKASRKLLVAIDESEHATAALHWALRNIARPEDYLYIVTVLAPIAAEVYPVAPIATAAAGKAATHRPCFGGTSFRKLAPLFFLVPAFS